MLIKEATIDEVDCIVDIHMQAFKGFFLTFLGKGFLKHLYKGFIKHPQSYLLVAVEKGKMLGFVAYSNNLSAFYKSLIKHDLFAFMWYTFCAFLRKPSAIMRLFRALSYSKKSKKSEEYVELSSIGVSTMAKNKGVGTALVKTVQERVDYGKFAYIKLETDAEKNDAVNNFYISNGFVLNHSYATPEGRRMNEYRYYKDVYHKNKKLSSEVKND